MSAPSSTTATSAAASASAAAAATGAQLTSLLSSFSERLRPLGAQASRGLSQVSQYAREKMGSATDVTELPQKYRELEDKVDRIRTLHEPLLKVSRNYTLPHYDYEPLLSESAKDFASTLSDRVQSLVQSAQAAAGSAAVPTSPTSAAAGSAEEIPRSLSHAFARAASTNADALGPEDPLGAALRRFAAAHDRVGAARLHLDADATAKFHQPFCTTLNQLIAHTMRARRNVNAVRLEYDAARARLRVARPEREEAARQEMEKIEDEFVAVVDDAMGKMTAVVESPEPLRNLADLVTAQLAYFKEAHEALAELAPEIDELQVTNEALLRHPSS
ncbi:hypothetical protein HK405_005666 [Cladochytrium tenue]|nr:hypothetical protein HK405_005666 [Cladochytrium tenue]